MTAVRAEQRRMRRLLKLCFAGLGGTAAVVPAIIPAYAALLQVPASVLLPAVAALFLGLLLGVVGSPLIASRTSVPVLLRIGAATQAVGLVLVALAPTASWFTLAAGLSGVGFGFVETGGAAAVRSLGAAATPQRLTALTVLIGAVATATPMVVLMFTSVGQARVAPAAVAAVHVIAAVRVVGAVTACGASSSANAETGARLLPSLRARPLSLLAPALLCYVGAESVLSGWSATTVTAVLGTGPAVAALGTSAFWLLMTAGRLIGTALATRSRAAVLVMVSTAAATCALATATAVGVASPAGYLALLAFAVVGFGPCYALILGLAVAAIALPIAVRGSSALVAIGAFGGALIPWVAATALREIDAIATASVAMGCAFALVVAAYVVGPSRSS